MDEFISSFLVKRSSRIERR